MLRSLGGMATGSGGWEDVRRLLVVAPNWLGDAVLALPAIADLRRAAPGADVTIAARPSIEGLFTMAPGLDRILPFDTREPGDRLVPRLRDGQYDVAILLPNSWRVALLVWQSGIAERWGYRADWRGPLLTRAVRRPPHGHQAAYYQHLVRALGAASGPLEPRVVVSDEARRIGMAHLTRLGWDGRAPLVAMAPGAAYGSAKRWPPGSYADVADGLARDGMTIVLVGAAADRGAGVEMLAAVTERDRVMNAIGDTDLPALAGVLAHCRALISNDSGAMHLAAAVGVPVTAVFGPTDECGTRPLGSGHTVITAPVWCRPCMLRTCPIDHRCMRRIEPAGVLASVRPSL